MSEDVLFGDSEPDIPDQDPDNFAPPDLSPEDVTDHIARQTANVLEGTGLIEIKELHSSVGQVHFFGRVKDSNKRKWSDLVKRILVVLLDHDGFMGTQNILKLKEGRDASSRNPDDYDQRFGHVVSIGARDIKVAAEAVCNMVLERNPSSRIEVTEAPMMGRGASQSGGRNTGRKGAHPTAGGAR
jgi:hypothetical protein